MTQKLLLVLLIATILYLLAEDIYGTNKWISVAASSIYDGYTGMLAKVGN